MSTEVTFADASKSEVADVLQERLIEQEYKIWKKNTPYLYVDLTLAGNGDTFSRSHLTQTITLFFPFYFVPLAMMLL